MSRDIFCCRNWGWRMGLHLASSERARDAAKCSTIHRTSPHSKEFLTSNIKNFGNPVLCHKNLEKRMWFQHLYLI